MSTLTSRLGLTKLATDGSDGVEIYREAIANHAGILDNAALILTPGLLSARPAAALNGRLYRATDNGHIYFDTGSAWTDLGTPDSGWLTVANGSISNGWANGVDAFGYRLLGNIMWLRGTLVGGPNASFALTFPSGFRPATNLTLDVVDTTVAAAAAQITTTGAMAVYFAGGGTVSFDGKSFPID